MSASMSYENLAKIAADRQKLDKEEEDLNAKLANIKARRKGLDKEQTRILQLIEDGDQKPKVEPTKVRARRRASPRGITSSALEAPEEAPPTRTNNAAIEPSLLLEQARKLQGNIVALDNGEVVAISCHMCSANVPASTQHVVNAFMDLHGLQQHYRIKHKDEVNVVGKGVQEVVRICRKDLLSKGDLERVVNREPPRTPSLMASKGRVEAAKSRKKRKATNDNPVSHSTPDDRDSSATLDNEDEFGQETDEATGSGTPYRPHPRMSMPPKKVKYNFAESDEED